MQFPRHARAHAGALPGKGYDFPEVYELAAEFDFTAHVRSRGEEAQQLKREACFRARRWVVERTQSWLNRFRRVLVRWAKCADTCLAMLHLACGLITSRAANWETYRNRLLADGSARIPTVAVRGHFSTDSRIVGNRPGDARAARPPR